MLLHVMSYLLMSLMGSLMILLRHTSRCHEGLTTFLFSFSPRKILISYSVNFYKRKVREDQIAHLSMGCTQGVFSLALALQQSFRGGPPTSNYFPFATQTCLEKFQGLYYEESF